MMLGGRLIEPVLPSTASCAPCHASRPASVTTNDGIPKKVTMNPLKRPISVPTRSPATIASAGSRPSFTLTTAITDAASPLTAPTERSISPSSNTSTTPIEIVATAAICRVRFERLTALRKRSLAIWKIVQITAIPISTRREPSSPRPRRRSASPIDMRGAVSAVSPTVLIAASPRSPDLPSRTRPL